MTLTGNRTRRHEALAWALGVPLIMQTPLAISQAVLEEVLVTAQKREQSLQEVPIAVQAIGTDQLKQAGVTSISDLSRISSGLHLGDTQAQVNAEIGIRGVTTAILGVGVEASTAVYLDGIYQRNLNAIARLVDVAQVEVLRGPQGTLFGRNAAAGAVNIRTHEPTEEIEGYIGGGVGSESLYSAEGVLNYPLSDNLLSRSSFSYISRDGWQTDTDLPGADNLYELDGYSVRTRLQWIATDSFTASLSLDHADDDGTRGGLLVEETGTLIPGAGFATTHDPDGNKAGASGRLLRDGEIVGFNSHMTSDTFGASVVLQWDISDDVQFSSLTSYRDSDYSLAAMPGGLFSLAPGVFEYFPGYIGTESYEFESINQEFRLSGATDSIDWFVGLNYFKDTSNQSINYALPLFATVGIGLGDLGDVLLESEAETDSYALFTDVIFSLTERINLTVGARYSYDEKSIEWADVAQAAPDIFYPDIANGIIPLTGFEAEADDDWDNISGRLVIDYLLDDDSMVYASVSQGYESGGFNTEISPFSDPQLAFEQEESTSYELGGKFALLDNALTLNAALFFNDYQDYQFQAAAPGSLAAVNLAGDAEVQGVELEMNWLLAEGLSLSGTLTYLDGEFTEDVPVTGPAGTELSVVDGQAMLRAPDWAGTLGLDYVVPMAGLGELRFNFSYKYSDSHRISNATTESLGGNGIDYRESDLESGSYDLLASRISYISASEQWTVSIWGTNLTDESYRDDDYIEVANAVYEGLASTARVYSRNEPRMYGLEIQYAF